MNTYLKEELPRLDINSIEVFLETWASSYNLQSNLRLFGFDSNGNHRTNPEFESVVTPANLMIAKHNLIAYMVMLRLKLMLEQNTVETVAKKETEETLKAIYSRLPEFAKFM